MCLISKQKYSKLPGVAGVCCVGLVLSCVVFSNVLELGDFVVKGFVTFSLVLAAVVGFVVTATK